MKKVKQVSTAMSTTKPFVPVPHPQQARLDAIRVVPSLVTPNLHFTPKGK